MDKKKIETEAEYKEQLKIYKKRMNKLWRNPYKFLSKPKEYLKKFEDLLEEMVYIGLVDLEWANSQRERFYRELNSPNEFKEWLSEKKEAIIKKFKRNGKI